MKLQLYVSAILEENSEKNILKFFKKDFDEELHSTLIYSRKEVELDEKFVDKTFKLRDYFVGFIEDIIVFESEKNILALKVNSDKLVDTHEKMMEDFKASYDFDEFIPHITLSYDFNGDKDKIAYLKNTLIGMKVVYDKVRFEKLDEEKY